MVPQLIPKMQTHGATKVLAFTDQEAEYLAQHRLGRLATITADGSPHVVPVTYEFDGESLYFSGWNLKKSLKYRNITGGNDKVAFVVDDTGGNGSTWSPKGVEVRGYAEAKESEDHEVYVRIVPLRKASWGFSGNNDN